MAGVVDLVDAVSPNARYLHLGGDEAWHLGKCPAGEAFVRKHGKAELYLRHYEPLLDRVIARGIRPILWHDMMQDWALEPLRRIGAKADLMVWGYGFRPDECKSHYRIEVIQRLHDAGVTMWAATAYKGDDGPTADLPTIENRARNAQGWVDVGQRFPFQGIVATAWSRHSTHRPQHEPIDGALDAVLHIGAILRDGVPPTGGIEASRQRLRGLGERERFDACHSALHDLSNARKDAWRLVGQLREQVALESRYPSRRAGGNAASLLASLRAAQARGKDAADRLRIALYGSVDKQSIEEYVHVRLAAIEAEIESLSDSCKRLG